jgi:hypothetical protein
MATNTTKKTQTKTVIHQVSKKKDRYDKLPDRLRKELRRTIAMVLYEKVHEQESMRMKEQEGLMQKLFYGEGGDTLSYLEMFLKCQGVFEGMFDANGDNSGTRRLKPVFARSSKEFVLGGNINRDVMERVQLSKTEIVTGRYLRSCAAEGGCEARKSLPFLLKHLDEETGRPLRSGDEIEDVVTKWLDDYYVYLESKNVTSPEKEMVVRNEDPASSDDDAELASGGLSGSATHNTPEMQEEDNIPSTPNKVSNSNGDVVITIPHRHSDWFFPGFMFVLLFGPFAENIEAKRTMDFFLNRDPAVTSASEKKAYGRSKMRETKPFDNNNSSSYETGSNKRRAISVSDELRIAGLEVKQASLQIQNIRVVIQSFESKLMAKKMEMDGIRSLMEVTSQMAKATNDWEAWHRLFKQYETCQEEMRALNAEHDAFKGRLDEVNIPSLAGIKRQPLQDDDCPIKEINTEERSSAASNLSSPMSNMMNHAKQSKN